ncbi:bleomycin resistance protein [Aquirufa sp. ROCK-SH2]
MRNKYKTEDYYINQLGFELLGDYGNYLLIKKEGIEIHFFSFESLDPNENDGQVYIRVTEIENLYQLLLDNAVAIHPNGHLEEKPWGQKEFSLLDPDNNLLTFGQSM